MNLCETIHVRKSIGFYFSMIFKSFNCVSSDKKNLIFPIWSQTFIVDWNENNCNRIKSYFLFSIHKSWLILSYFNVPLSFVATNNEHGVGFYTHASQLYVRFLAFHSDWVPMAILLQAAASIFNVISAINMGRCCVLIDSECPCSNSNSNHSHIFCL